MQKRWVIKEKGDQALISKLSAELNINEHLSNLLVQRGIASFDEAKQFFRPELTMLHDPFLMKDMDKAITRIQEAIKNNQRILVYGDYDVDGTTAVSLIYTFFKQFTDKLDFYIPDRYNEGYGVSPMGIDYAASKDVNLVIALDCGIKANEQVAYAQKKNIDFIICDHHRPGHELPDALAILDPKIPDCPYPYKELSGCGLGFKLIQAYAIRYDIPFDNLMKYLDLVVVSIAADIVPITGENRILAFYGLKLMNTSPRPGLEAILKCSNIERKPFPDRTSIFSKELTINDLVFLVGPRINAAGRIESGKNSVKLLVADDLKTSIDIAEQINNYNMERRNLDAIATQEALEMIRTDKLSAYKKSNVVYKSDWHKGVIGIVASRIIENFYKPTIVLTSSNGVITGSARSIKNFDIYDAIDECSEYLEHFGGHKYAAGLSIKEENLEAFINKFEETVSTRITEEMLIPEIEIDAVVNLNHINPKFYKILKQFAPFGPGNMAPTFMTDNVVDTGFSRLVGNNHIKLHMIHPNISSLPYYGIAFQQSQHFEAIQKGISYKAAYHLEENEWNGKISLQLNVKDIKFD